MERFDKCFCQSKKKVRATERVTTSALFLLRCVQLGLSMEDLESLDVGMIYDMMNESANDECEYDYLATKDDIKNF